MSDYLTPEELARLTGYKQCAKQRQWLRARQWVHEVTAQREIIVPRAYRDERLGMAKTIENAPENGAKPRISAFYFLKPPA